MRCILLLVNFGKDENWMKFTSIVLVFVVKKLYPQRELLNQNRVVVCIMKIYIICTHITP